MHAGRLYILTWFLSAPAPYAMSVLSDNSSIVCSFNYEWEIQQKTEENGQKRNTLRSGTCKQTHSHTHFRWFAWKQMSGPVCVLPYVFLTLLYYNICFVSRTWVFPSFVLFISFMCFVIIIHLFPVNLLNLFGHFVFMFFVQVSLWVAVIAPNNICIKYCVV